ncbi:MAG: hypothetical protein RLP44_04270 [Aggregatilineales bacterium]
MLRLIFVFLLLIISACGTTSTPTNPSQTAIVTSSENVHILWAHEGNLNIFDDQHIKSLISSGDVSRALLSPSGMQIAIVRVDQALSVMNIGTLEGADEQEINVGQSLNEREINQLIWEGENTLFFNTSLAGQDLNAAPQNDLYRVDVTSGEAELLLSAGAGGNFALNTFSDDQSVLAIIQPGVYGESDGQMSVYMPDSGEKRDLLTFPAVATGTHLPFYPMPQWVDANTFLVVIPDPDQLYHEAEADFAPVSLWRLTLEGEATLIGTIRASLFGLPLGSPDGSKIAYLRRDLVQQGANRYELVIADTSGGNPRVVDSGDVGVFSLLQWLDDTRFAYVNEGLRLVTENGDPVALASGSVVGTPQLSGDYATYLTYVNQAFVLNLLFLDGESAPIEIINGLSDPTFDLFVLEQAP